MGMTIEEIIQGIEVIKAQAEWEYPLDWQIVLDGAIETMHKYQKIADLYDYWRSGKCEYTISCMENIGKVLREGMMTDNLCDSCTNIGCEFQSGIVRTKCNFYMPPHIEPDNCGNYVVMQPTVEAIPKDQYEARLKAEREKIAEDVANKMNYMGSCLNEKNIILGIITGKRETTDSLCPTCKSECCVSNGTAICKADFEARLKADMVAILTELQLEIEEQKRDELSYQQIWNYPLNVCVSIIQQKINELKENEDGNR